jgi:hypothetical protein
MRQIVADLMDVPEANRYFADTLSGVHLRCEFPYPATAPVGQHCQDMALVAENGTSSRLHEHLRSGRGLLLLTPATRGLEERVAGPVDVVAVTGVDPLLLRPDGVIAWVAGDHASLDTALDTWFGARTASPLVQSSEA